LGQDIQGEGGLPRDAAVNRGPEGQSKNNRLQLTSVCPFIVDFVAVKCFSKCQKKAGLEKSKRLLQRANTLAQK